VSGAFTPGPWSANTTAVWSGDKIVASVYGDDPDCHPDERMVANASLIAAAPDHHAVALELDRLMLVIESAVRWQDKSNHAAVLAMLKANRAAIRKATGEQA
jgi:hypothetical protein